MAVDEKTASRWNGYFYPGTTTLINKLGIRNDADLEEFEYESTAARTQEMVDRPVVGNFDLAHLQEVHRRLFSDTYEWAGQIRDVPLVKGTSKFVSPESIVDQAGVIQSKLVENNFMKGLAKPAFVELFSAHYSELNKLHPFREGNGRSTRIVLEALAENAGYTLDQTRIDNNKDQWNKAAAASHVGNLEPIRKMFNEALRPTRALMFETLPRDIALAHHPELAPAYARLDARESGLKGLHPGNEKAQAVFLGQAKAEITRALDSGTMHAFQPAPEPRQADQRRALLERAKELAKNTISDPAARDKFLLAYVKQLNAQHSKASPEDKVQQPKIAGQGPRLDR